MVDNERQSMKPTLVIMAAGMGSRYGGLKQMDAMGPSGETLLEYSVYDAVRAGFEKVVFIIRRDFEKEFKEAIGKRFKGVIDVDYAFQALDDLPPGFCVPTGREKPWGTSHAILCARYQVHTPFTVQNADDFYGEEAYNVIAEELKKMNNEDTTSCMVGFEVQNTLSPHGAVTRGVCEEKDGYLTEVVERMQIRRNEQGIIQYIDGESAVDMSGSEICSMNFWGFTPALFKALEKRFARFLKAQGDQLKSEWLIPTTIDEMIKRRETQVKVLASRDHWFGVTYPEDKAQVMEAINNLVSQGKYPSPLFG